MADGTSTFQLAIGLASGGESPGPYLGSMILNDLTA